MTYTEARRTLSAPGDWDRYYQVHTDLGPVLGTPGLELQPGGTPLPTPGGTFAQRAERGFFLTAEQPVQADPLAVSAALSGAPTSGFLASVSGPRRRRARRTETGTHIDVEQVVRGARLVGGEMRLHQDGGAVFAVTGRPLGDLTARDPGEAPPLAIADALSTCQERFEIEGGLLAATAEQVVFPMEEGAVWAYEVAFVVPDHSADVRAYLRADDMALLLSYNVSSAATGRARVYAVNPLQTPDLEDVALEGLEEPGHLLRGATVDVTQAVAPRVERDDGDFTIDPSDTAFDEVQAYHHVWRVTQWFAGVVDAAMLQAKPFTPMRAFVNDPGSPNNAYFAPTTGELRFGNFGRRSSARSAAVVCHEFGHAVTDSICQLGRAKVQNTESRGLSEGFSDYFAAAFLDDPRIGDYVADDPHGARNCSDPGLRFPDRFDGEEHATGAVWAAVLWGIRQRLGADTTNRLVIESVEFLGPSATFSDARMALQTVDEKLFQSANTQTIDEEFDSRSPA
jgi:hypothetical protein